MNHKTSFQIVVSMLLIASLLLVGCAAPPRGPEVTIGTAVTPKEVVKEVTPTPASTRSPEVTPEAAVTPPCDLWQPELQHQYLPQEPLNVRFTSTEIVALGETRADFASFPLLGELVPDDAGEDEIMIVFAVLDAEYILLNGSKEKLANCLEYNSLDGCLNQEIWPRRKLVLKYYWMQNTPTYSMNTGDVHPLNEVLLPENETREWEPISPPVICQSSESLTAIIPIRLVAALMFELDEVGSISAGGSKVLKNVKDRLEALKMVSQIESASEAPQTLSDLEKTILSELRKAEIQAIAVSEGATAAAGELTGALIAGAGGFVPGAAAGMILGALIGTLVSYAVPEFVGLDTITFTATGYLSNAALELLDSGDYSETTYRLVCESTPIKQYDPEIRFYQFSGAGAHYVLTSVLELPFPREPDPQTIEVSPESMSFTVVGPGGRPQPLTISNTGTEVLKVCSIRPGARFGVRLADGPGACPNLHPQLDLGQSCQVKIYRTTGAKFGSGEYEFQSQLRIRSNDWDNRLVLVGLEVRNK